MVGGKNPPGITLELNNNDVNYGHVALKNIIPLITIAIYLSAMVSIPAGSSVETEQVDQAISVVEIEIQEEEITIDISIGKNRTSVLHCTASLTPGATLIFDSVDVNLIPTMPDYVNSVNLSKQAFTLTRSENQVDFTATVNVMEETSSSVDDVVEIGGEATLQPSGRKAGVSPDTSTIRVAPYYGGEVSFVNPASTIEQGGKKEFILLVENLGNSGDTFHLAVLDKDLLRNRGIRVKLETDTVDVAEGGTTEVKVEVEVDKEAGRGSSIVKIEIWSDNKGPSQKEESRALLTITVEERVIGFLRGTIFSDPIYMWLALFVVVVLVGIVIFLGVKLRDHLAWKRAIKRMKRPPSG